MQKAQRNAAVRFFDPSHLFILLNFDYLDVYGSLVWGFSFCVEMLDDNAIVAVVGAIFPSAGPMEREREREIKGGQNTREI